MKVKFVYDPEPDEKFLDIMSKMTPQRSCKWKDMKATTNDSEADFFVVIDSTHKQLPKDRTIYISAHPYIEGYSGHADIENKECLAKLDLKHTFGFGEWWLKYDYDYLSKFKLPKKTELVCCIMSNVDGDYGRTRRKEYIKNLTSIYPSINVYGTIKGVGKGALRDGEEYQHGKEKVLSKHKFSIEIDTGPTKHYFSERVFDSLLMWCKPLYWGGTNLEDYLPKECFSYIDIYSEGKDVLQAVKEEVDYKAIGEARHLLLNKYQLWARIYDLIKSL
jgi:hypothetical protein